MVVARARQILVATATLAVAGGLLVPVPARAAAVGCAAGFASDFNGDGRTDTVAADPNATVDGQANAGRVVVLYGDADGKVGEGARGVTNQGKDNVGGVPDAGDRFGSSLALADIDCDDFTDLVVGTPYEDIGANADSGYVQVIWGAVGGLGTGADSVNYTQVNFGLAQHAGDQFGYAVDALEDLGQGGTPAPDAYALAIGVPGYDVGGDNDAGVVALRHAFDGGNVTRNVSQDSPGVADAAEAGDRFGAAVSVDYLLGEVGTVDVAVGVPNEDVGSVVDAGLVTILRDVYLPPDGVSYTQDSAGVASFPEPGDRFGYSLDSVRVGSTTRLAVGVPYEDISAAGSAGLVQLFSGNGSTLTAGTGLTQDTAGVANTAETGDLFGDRVVWVRPGVGTASTQLAVSVPSEDGTANNSGLIQVFPVTDLDAEVSYAQSSPGIPGTAQAGDRFGAALATVRGPTEQVLVVGAPDDAGDTLGMVAVIPFGGGAARSWVPGAGGIPTGGAVRFGAALAGPG